MCLNIGERFGKVHSVAKADFFGVGRDVPFVVLNQIQNRQLAQRSHVEGFGHLPFGHGCITNGADHNRCFFPAGWSVNALLLAILHAHGYSSCGDGLHSSCRALVRNFWEAIAIEAGMTVIRASSTERIVTLRQQLEHELIGAHADSK